MNLKEQQYIVTLAGCGSMTQAAKKLNITQPALSSYLAGVENSLGYPLFERTGKALRPTYLGEALSGEGQKDPGAGGGVPAAAGTGPPRLSGPDPGGDPDPPLAPPDPLRAEDLPQPLPQCGGGRSGGQSAGHD